MVSAASGVALEEKTCICGALILCLISIETSVGLLSPTFIPAPAPWASRPGFSTRGHSANGQGPDLHRGWTCCPETSLALNQAPKWVETACRARTAAVPSPAPAHVRPREFTGHQRPCLPDHACAEDQWAPQGSFQGGGGHSGRGGQESISGMHRAGGGRGGITLAVGQDSL